jgi:hypothetical protein
MSAAGDSGEGFREGDVATSTGGLFLPPRILIRFLPTILLMEEY